MGKSAQFPLHVWLPDAMEGPTPVSALIHAATMVNAGVYLVARANPLFAARAEAMVVVAAIGIFTAILAASIALTQTDIKRVLAYSTLSASSATCSPRSASGAFTAAIFHLMTHGFFKGLLFLGSGSVIHAVHEEQDMRRMGGLWRRRSRSPTDDAHRLAGDRRASRRWPASSRRTRSSARRSSSGFLWVWAIGFVVAGMTAFYMFRLMGLTFWGAFRVDPGASGTKIHESPPVMTVPLILLAIPSVFLGHRSSGLPFGASRITELARRRSSTAIGPDARPRRRRVRAVRHRRRADPRQRRPWRSSASSIALAAVRRRHRRPADRRPDPSASASSSASGCPFLYRASLNKWWFDELNHLLFIVIGGRVADAPVVVRPRRSSTAPSTAIGALDASTPAAGCAASRPAGSRTTPWASRSGCIVMAGSYLVIVGRRDDDRPTSRSSRSSRSCRCVGAIVVAILPSRVRARPTRARRPRSSTWVVSLAAAARPTCPDDPASSSS